MLDISGLGLCWLCHQQRCRSTETFWFLLKDEIRINKRLNLQSLIWNSKLLGVALVKCNLAGKPSYQDKCSYKLFICVVHWDILKPTGAHAHA